MQEDQELASMQITYTAIKDLDDDAKRRVVDWLIGKFSLNVNNKSSAASIKSESERTDSNDIHEILSRNLPIAEFFGRIVPNTDAEKVLLVAAFLQVNQGVSELTSRQINDELKHLVHGVSNITATIGVLISRKPNMMIQTRKEGKTQQAQKKYRVTAEGFNMVMEMAKNKI